MPYWFDGNNLIGKSAAELKSDFSLRRAFLQQLAAFHRQRGGHFLVFFDGDDPDRAVPPQGVQVRYSAPESTDDVMLRRLRDSRRPAEIIVVTNDRELRTRCRNAGAKVMIWDEFMSAMKRPAPARASAEKSEAVDVDDWMRYFGLDKDSAK
jgi:predicted RNA-binding protein with PIN domain